MKDSTTAQVEKVITEVIVGNSHSFGQASEDELARLIVQVARTVQADAILCAADTAAFPRRLHRLSDQVRIIAAATSEETYDTLIQSGLEAVRLPLRQPTSTIKSATLSRLRSDRPKLRVAIL